MVNKTDFGQRPAGNSESRDRRMYDLNIDAKFQDSFWAESAQLLVGNDTMTKLQLQKKIGSRI